MDTALNRAFFLGLALFLSVGLAPWPARGAATLSAPLYHLDLPTHISGVGQSCSSSVILELTHDTPCSIAISVAQPGDELLHLAGGDSLVTSYMLTGPGLQNADGDWVASTQFLTHIYNVPGPGPVDQFTLAAQATAPSNTALHAGNYSASLIVTVSW